MDYQYRWEIIEELGEGGQGKVYRVLDTKKFNIDKQIRPFIQRSIQTLGSSMQAEETKKESFKSFRKAIIDLFRSEDASHHGALKVLHKPEDARDADRAGARMNHRPNLIKVLDADPDSKWFVSQYYSKRAETDRFELKYFAPSPCSAALINQRGGYKRCLLNKSINYP